MSILVLRLFLLSDRFGRKFYDDTEQHHIICHQVLREKKISMNGVYFVLIFHNLDHFCSCLMVLYFGNLLNRESFRFGNNQFIDSNLA